MKPIGICRHLGPNYKLQGASGCAMKQDHVPGGFRLLLAGGLLTGIAALHSSPAHADLRLCNKTATQVGIAIGYKSADDWVSEGWWNIEGDSCQVIVTGTLTARYYYLYALDYKRGGEWAGSAFMCTRAKEFTIKGAKNCEARGFEKTGFIEVDTGDQSSWTVQLTEKSKTGIGGQ